MITIEHMLAIGALLILTSIAIARVSDNLGVPTLLLFLVVGMLAGSEGPGGIYFDDASLAQSIGIIALVIILFAGGLDTSWREVRPVVRPAGILATLGVLLTALAVGLFVAWLLGVPLLAGLLLGAIVSSTDAAAVFSVLRSKNVGLRKGLKPLLELESGSNDPMAVFLTVGIIGLLTDPAGSGWDLAWLFASQMGIGAVCGLGLGKAMVLVINRLKLSYDGLYAVFALAFVVLAYSGTALVGGSGFLAVYVAGLVAGNSEFIQKKGLLRFFDGLAWLSQITMFLTMGLLVFPSQVAAVVGPGLLISVFLMVVARPISVFLCLAGSPFGWREKALISWVGLRGAVPIILAVFPMIAGVPNAGALFNIVFFIVLTSALLQGWSIPPAARLLRLDAPIERRRRYPIEFAAAEGADTELLDLIIPSRSAAAGKSIIGLGMPPDNLIVLISRNDGYLVPSGGTVLQEGDTVLALVNRNNLAEVRAIFTTQRAPGEEAPAADAP